MFPLLYVFEIIFLVNCFCSDLFSSTTAFCFLFDSAISKLTIIMYSFCFEIFICYEFLICFVIPYSGVPLLLKLCCCWSCYVLKDFEETQGREQNDKGESEQEEGFWCSQASFQCFLYLHVSLLSLISLFFFHCFFVVFYSNKSLLPVLNDREDFRKSFKENHPDNKSVSAVRFQTQ